VVTWRWGAAGALALALAGCTALAGYRDYTYAAPSAATCAPVVLPTAGNGRIRLVNAGTVGAASDFCVRASGTSDWGSPLFFAGPKAGCDTGLAYATATAPFAVPSGSIDVEAIAPGGSCGKGATSSATSLVVGDETQGAPVLTVIRFGGGSGAEQLVAHAEEPGAQGANAQLRIVNALSGPQSINVGAVSSTTLPQSIGSTVFPQSISIGDVSSPGSTVLGPADGTGYLSFEAYGATLGLVLANDTSAFAAFEVTEGRQSVFAIGDPQNNTHPIRGLVCPERPVTTTPDASAAALLAPCVQTDLPTLSIDTVDTSLYGAGAPYEGERRDAVYAAIAARPSDVICLTDIDDQSDKDGVASAAKSAFPYVYEITTDLTTRPTDPAQADGGIPPTPTAPPCNGVGASDLQAIFACTASKCSTTGDMTGTLAFTDDCLSQACTPPFTQVYGHGDQGNACFDCVVDYLTSFQTLAYAQSECTSDARSPFAFNGQSTAMILSRYPLANTDSYVLPSTGWRREILYAEIELEDVPVDFYCVELTTPGLDADEPYVGSYGQDVTTVLSDGGVSLENGYEDEQNLQVQRAIGYIRQKSAQTGRAAIITGLWNSSVAAQDPAGNTLVAGASPEVTRALDDSYDGGAFVRAAPAGYQPACEQCPTNPYDTYLPPLDYTATYLFQYPASSTTDESLWGTANDVPIHGSEYEPAPDGGLGPVFEIYPRNVRVVRPRSQ
jgi:hypothetical protein